MNMKKHMNKYMLVVAAMARFLLCPQRLQQLMISALR